jgi:hypothetical protein
VRRLAGQVPVAGRVVFVGDVEFRGGKVPHTVTLEELEAEFSPEDESRDTQASDAIRNLWQKIDEASRRYAA